MQDRSETVQHTSIQSKKNCALIFTGLNLNPLPINPAIVAALNQWGLIGNMNQNQDQNQVSKTKTLHGTR